MEIIDIVKTAVKAADSKKGQNIEAIHVSDLTIVADYFVLVSGSSSTQVKALADEIEFKLSEAGVEPLHTEGKTSGWICLDYASVIVHVFYEKERDFYQIERLWQDGEKIDVTKLLEE